MRNEFYEDLVRRNDIVAVARELGLEVRGTKCRCFHPEGHAHGDRTPSLSLDARRNTFRCWVCPDVWGSVIDLVMQVRGVPRAEAVRYLAARAGMDLPQPGSKSGPRGHYPGTTAAPQGAVSVPSAGAPTPIPPHPHAPIPPHPSTPAPGVDDEKTNAIFTAFLRWCLHPTRANYLTRKRGISPETIERMRIVWVPDLREHPLESRLRDQFPEEELLGSGLFNEWGLIFRHHPIVFPFLHRGRVLFLQGRRTDAREPKYLSARRPIPCLYNHDLLETLAPGDPVLLCEGVIDTLTWLDQGVAAVGILGVGTFKTEWLEALRPFQVLLCLDTDEPGRKAAHALRERFAAAGQEARIVALPEAVKDVNQLFVERPDLVRALENVKRKLSA